MSKDRKKLLHMHSSVNDKQPTPSSLEFGELAVNNAKEGAFISTKNSNDEVVRFSEDDTIIDWMEYKSVIPYEGKVKVFDRKSNKSTLNIKLNQYVPKNTPYGDVVNNAVDKLDNSIVNPSTDDGLTNGAGISIDMSDYVLTGGAASFSASTVECSLTVNGTTNLIGADGDCGSALNVHVDAICEEAEDTATIYGEENTNLGVNCAETQVSKTTNLKGEYVNVNARTTANTHSESYIINTAPHIGISADTDFTIYGQAGSISGDTLNIMENNNVNIGTDAALVSGKTLTLKESEYINASATTTTFTDERFNLNSTATNISGTSLNIEEGTTDIRSCEKFKVNSNNVIFEDCEGDDGHFDVNTDNICLKAEETRIYGKKTEIGLSCDGFVSPLTEVKGSVINENGTEINVSAVNSIKENSPLISFSATNKVDVVGSNEVNVNGDNVSVSGKSYVGVSGKSVEEVAETNLTAYGKTQTNLGIECDECQNGSQTNIKGWEINEHSSTDINTNADRNICINANYDANFYGAHKTTIGVNCDGDITPDLSISGANITISGTSTTIYRKPNENLSATTVEGSINEAYLRSQITLNKVMQPASSDILAIYEIYQNWDADCNQAKVGEISIPRDFLVADAALVKGVWNGSEFVEDPSCTGTNCGRAIKLVLNTKDPISGHPVYKNLYINVDDLVKDLDVSNPTDRGVTLSLTYDGSKNILSATTKVIVNGVSATTWQGTNTVTIGGSDIYLTNYTCGSTNQNNPNITASDTLNDAICKLNSGKVNPADIKTLSWSYNSVKTSSDDSYNPYTSTNSFVIPKDIQDVFRQKLSWEYGDVKAEVGNTYDPGEGTRLTDRTSSKKIVIPNSLKKLTNDLDFLKFTSGSFSESETPWQYRGDGEKTIKIPTDAKHISMRGVDFVGGQFTAKSYNPQTGDLGVNDSPTKVYIPTKPSHIGMQTLSFRSGDFDDSTIIDFNGEKSGTIFIPTCVRDLDRSKLYFEAGSYDENVTSYDPGHDCQTAEKSQTIKIPTTPLHVGMHTLTIGKGSHSADTFTSFNGTQDGAINIPTNVHELFRKNITITHGSVTELKTDRTYDPGLTAQILTVPTDASHINVNILSPSYGSVKDAVATNYNPGEGTTGITNASQRSTKLVIPNSLTHLKDVNNAVFTSGSFSDATYDPTAGATINIPTDAKHISMRGVDFVYGDTCNAGDKSYAPSNDTNTTVYIPKNLKNLGYTKLNVRYGSTSAEEIQTFDPGSTTDSCTVGTSDITIPSCVSHLNRHKITFQSGSTSMFNNQTYDPGSDCANLVETINIPTSVSHLNRGTLTYTHNGFSETFDLANNATFTAPHSALSVTYGATSDKSGSVTYDTSAAQAVSVPTDVSHLNRGTLTYTHNGFTSTFDPASDATFTAPHSTLTINYGPSCSENVDGITYDTSGDAQIVVPKTISDITGGAIELNECSGSCVTVNGNVCASGIVKATAVYSTSDENLKENIHELGFEDYHKASYFGFKSFNFKDDETKTKTYGVIAQEVQAAGLDNIVHKDDKGNLSVDYTSLLILKIANLENTVRSLTEELKNLKGKLESK